MSLLLLFNQTSGWPTPVVPGVLLYEPPGAEYFIAFVGQQTQYRQGANGPLLFSIWRSDGGPVAIPTISACTVVLPDESEISADLANPSSPADPTKPSVYAASPAGFPVLQVGVQLGEGGFSQVGDYLVDLELSWGPIIASTPAPVSISCGP